MHGVQLIVYCIISSDIRLDLGNVIAICINQLLHRDDPAGINHKTGSDIINLYQIRSHISDLCTFQFVNRIIIFSLVNRLNGNAIGIFFIEFIDKIIHCLAIDTAHGMPEGNRGSLRILV